MLGRRSGESDADIETVPITNSNSMVTFKVCASFLKKVLIQGKFQTPTLVRLNLPRPPVGVVTLKVKVGEVEGVRVQRTRDSSRGQ